jgi:hypothetical protein
VEKLTNIFVALMWIGIILLLYSATIFLWTLILSVGGCSQ